MFCYTLPFYKYFTFKNILHFKILHIQKYSIFQKWNIGFVTNNIFFVLHCHLSNIPYSRIFHISKYSMFQNKHIQTHSTFKNILYNKMWDIGFVSYNKNFHFTFPLSNIPCSKIFHISKYSIFQSIPYFKIFHI